jgi:hypothetical protein
MTFLDALRANRPIRRTKRHTSIDTIDGKHEWFITGPWIWIGNIPRPPGEYDGDPWLRLDTGARVTLTREDYLAEDWEPMP